MTSWRRFIDERGLAMDLADIQFCQRLLRRGGPRPLHHRDQDDRHLLVRPLPPHHLRHRARTRWKSPTPTCRPPSTATWSCAASLARDEKPVCLMDMGTIGAKWLKKEGMLTGLDESEEINACTIKCKVDVDGAGAGLAVPVQERDPQPSHRDRALRRRGHLRGRRHPRPAVRAAPTCTRPCASPARPIPRCPWPTPFPASCPSASW